MRLISGAAVLGLWMLGAGPAVPALAADPPAALPRFEVSGIMLQDDGKAWALIAEPQLTGGAVRLFTPGAMIGPYRLVDVKRDHVVLQLSSETPFRVPYSWRGGGTAVATQPPADRASTARTQPRTPNVPSAPAVTAPPTVPATEADQDSERADGDSSVESAPAAGGSAVGNRATGGTAGGGAQPQSAATPSTANPAAAPAAPPVTTPSAAQRLITGYDPARIEAWRRERERMFRQDLSIEGFHQRGGTRPDAGTRSEPSNKPDASK